MSFSNQLLRLTYGLCWLLIASTGSLTFAAESYQDFLRGLRERQYFDMAVFYLDQLATQKDVPKEVRELIPYEKAITLLESSRVTRSPDRQVEQLDQALAFLGQFVKESPNHPQVADANSERAQILIGKARVEILQSKAPANQAAKGEYQDRARKVIAQARQVFDAAYKQHEAAWKGFGTYINKETEPDKFAARAQSEVNMIRSQLDLALCTYEEAQTYDVGSPDFVKFLNQAAGQFEEMHQRYRSQVGGLYARLWQAKCFEETNDLQKALGIYNELLAHPGTEGSISRLKDQTLQFKLISLNTDARKDYQLVVDLGEEWLKNNKVESRTRTGLGIRWQVARAYELLGDQRELPPTDAQRFWRLARDSAQQVNRFPGEYKDVSLSLIQRLDVKIGGKERKPDSFDAAFGLGRQLVTNVKDTKDQLDAARAAKQPPEEIKKLEQTLAGLLSEAAEAFDLGLRLVNRSDDAKSVTMARYMYAYINFLQRKNYEAAILGEFVARTADKEDTTTGLDAAYLSMAAYVQAYNDAKGTSNDKDADLNFIIGACNLLSDHWPESDRANDARMTLGRIYGQLKKPVEAASWYNKIPPTDAKYAEAQLAAGQSFWTAYLTVGRGVDDAEKPTNEQLAAWREQADQLLRSGIAKIAATAPKEGVSPPELIAAKMSLAQIVLSQGKDADAIKLLLDEPHSVIKAITVPDETKRPTQGVQSRQFATETYKLLLRSYIGNGKLNEARETMKTLEKVAGAEAGADVTELYVGLGKLLREELDRFQAAGETDRFNALMTSFETFLNDLYSRQEGQTFGSLSWIGETYFALGEASSKDPTRSMASFEKAGKAFEEILKKAETNPNFMPADQAPAVKVRLVRCYRLKKDFETSQTVLADVLKLRERDLRAQFEGAELYQAWGDSGDVEKYMTSIIGDSKLKVWGWRNLSVRLQNMVEGGRAEFMDMLMDARLRSAECRRQYALAQTNLEKRTSELGLAEMELVATITVNTNIPEAKFTEMNRLYHEILKDSGKPITDLVASKEVVATAEETVVEQKAPKAKQPVKTATAVPAAAPSNSTLPLIIFVVIAVAGIGAAAWFVMTRTKRKPVMKKSPATAAAFGGISVGGPSPSPGSPASISAPAAKPRTRPAASSSSADPTKTPSTTGTAAKRPASKPAGPATAAGATPPVPRPKPKPPTP